MTPRSRSAPSATSPSSRGTPAWSTPRSRSTLSARERQDGDRAVRDCDRHGIAKARTTSTRPATTSFRRVRRERDGRLQGQGRHALRARRDVLGRAHRPDATARRAPTCAVRSRSTTTTRPRRRRSTNPSILEGNAGLVDHGLRGDARGAPSGGDLQLPHGGRHGEHDRLSTPPAARSSSRRTRRRPRRRCRSRQGEGRPARRGRRDVEARAPEQQRRRSPDRHGHDPQRRQQLEAVDQRRLVGRARDDDVHGHPLAGERARGQGQLGDGRRHGDGGRGLHRGQRRPDLRSRRDSRRRSPWRCSATAIDEENETLKVNLSNPIGHSGQQRARRPGRRHDHRQERAAVALDQRHDRARGGGRHLHRHARGHDAADGDGQLQHDRRRRRRPAPTSRRAPARSRSRRARGRRRSRSPCSTTRRPSRPRTSSSASAMPVNATITKNRGLGAIEASDQVPLPPTTPIPSRRSGRRCPCSCRG